MSWCHVSGRVRELMEKEMEILLARHVSILIYLGHQPSWTSDMGWAQKFSKLV